jgi:glycosidase
MEGGEDPDNRRDFPGGWPGDARDAFTRGGRTEREQKMFEWTRDWIRLRREHESIRRGRLVDLFFDDDAYAFARQTETETVVIAFNRAAAPKKVTAPANFIDAPDGSRLAPLITARDAGSVAGGTISFDVPARSAVAFKLVRPTGR